MQPPLIHLTPTAVLNGGSDQDTEELESGFLEELLALMLLRSPVRRLVDEAFASTLEFKVMKHLASARRSSSLQEIAAATGSSRYDVLLSHSRVGKLRRVIERMVENGMVERCGNDYRPRYRLDPRSVSSGFFVELYRPDGHPRGRHGRVGGFSARDGSPEERRGPRAAS